MLKVELKYQKWSFFFGFFFPIRKSLSTYQIQMFSFEAISMLDIKPFIYNMTIQVTFLPKQLNQYRSMKVNKLHVDKE
jgi:hypothetical protein